MLLIIGGPFSEGLSPSGCRESCTNRSASGGPREFTDHGRIQNTHNITEGRRKLAKLHYGIVVVQCFANIHIDWLHCLILFCYSMQLLHTLREYYMHSVGACHCCTFGNTTSTCRGHPEDFATFKIKWFKPRIPVIFVFFWILWGSNLLDESVLPSVAGKSEIIGVGKVLCHVSSTVGRAVMPSSRAQGLQ